MKAYKILNFLKYNFISIGLFLFITFNCQANDNPTPEKKHSIGLLVGGGLSSLGDFYFPNKSSLSTLDNARSFSYCFGLSYDYKLFKSLWVHTELDFVSKGGGYESENQRIIVFNKSGATAGINYYRLKLNYLEIPLLVKIPFSSSSQSIYTLLGPCLSFLTSATFKSNEWVIPNSSNNAGLVQATSVETEINVNNVNPFDLPIIVALGMDLNGENNSKYSMEIRTSFGTLPALPVGYNYISTYSLLLKATF